jgi:hypothetical protein
MRALLLILLLAPLAHATNNARILQGMAAVRERCAGAAPFRVLVKTYSHPAYVLVGQDRRIDVPVQMLEVAFDREQRMLVVESRRGPQKREGFRLPSSLPSSKVSDGDPPEMRAAILGVEGAEPTPECMSKINDTMAMLYYSRFRERVRQAAASDRRSVDRVIVDGTRVGNTVTEGPAAAPSPAAAAPAGP